jgi:hypothetical protein
MGLNPTTDLAVRKEIFAVLVGASTEMDGRYRTAVDERHHCVIIEQLAMV